MAPRSGDTDRVDLQVAGALDRGDRRLGTRAGGPAGLARCDQALRVRDPAPQGRVRQDPAGAQLESRVNPPGSAAGDTRCISPSTLSSIVGDEKGERDGRRLRSTGRSCASSRANSDASR